MPINIQLRGVSAQAGMNQTVICRVSSGWVVLRDRQFLSGYCFLLPDPAVPSWNDLSRHEHLGFISDMAAVGDVR